MHRRLAMSVLVMLSLVNVSIAVAGAQTQADAQTLGPISQLIRDAGHSLTDAEAAYLDADQQVGGQYVALLFQVVTLAGPDPGVPDAATQANVVAELQRLLALDPAASPQAPPSLQALRELVVEQRAGIRRAAARWLEALQAGDPDWRLRGNDELAAAQQSLVSWQQELASRYPLPTP